MKPNTDGVVLVAYYWKHEALADVGGRGGRRQIMVKMADEKKVHEAVAALDSVAREWLRRPGVTAIDVGFKIKGEKMTEQVALRAHVERKVPPDQLAGSEMFNETGKRSKTVKGFPVDVVEATYGVADQATVSVVDRVDQGPIVLEDADGGIETAARQVRVRPIMGGFSCGNARVTAGTIGAIVFNRATCQPMILSNWHVLAGSPAATVGEEIWQPGRLDGGSSSDRVATLSQMVLDNRMDAAVAAIDSSVAHDREVVDLGVIRGHEDPRLGMLVVKSGRTTDVTRGVIDGVSLRTSINYASAGVTQSFQNQIRIVPRAPWPAVADEISSGGDSGSVWINERTDRAVGLHFAGETSPAIADENAIASPIGPIMTQFNISFLPVICPRPPVLNICQRFPEICRILLRDLFPFPFPFPLPDPSPIDGVDPVRPPIGTTLGATPQSAAGCSCQGPAASAGIDPNMTVGDLLAMLSQ